MDRHVPALRVEPEIRDVTQEEEEILAPVDANNNSGHEDNSDEDQWSDVDTALLAHDPPPENGDAEAETFPFTKF